MLSPERDYALDGSDRQNFVEEISESYRRGYLNGCNDILTLTLYQLARQKLIHSLASRARNESPSPK